MAKGILLWPNVVDDQVTPPTFSGGRWLADQPIEWVRDDGVETGYSAYAARSDTAEPTDTTFTIDHGQQVAVKAVAIPEGNFGIDAEITVERSNVADFSVIEASVTGPVYPVIYPLGTVPSYSPYFIAGRPISRLAKMPWIAAFTSISVASYTRVSISDAANPDGYVEFPRLFMAGGYLPFYNMDLGAELKPLNRTRTRESIAGARFHDVRPARRQWSLTYQNIPHAELWSQLWELQAQLGVSMQAFFAFDIDDPANTARHSFPCTLEDPAGVIVSSHFGGGARLVLSEVLA